jgi:polar amino acid transport system substrate-binding protein
MFLFSKCYLVFVMFFVVLAVEARELVVTAPKGAAIQDVSELIMKEAYRELDIELKVIRQPAQRALQTANAGLVDGELSRVKKIGANLNNLIRVPVIINHIEGTAFSKNNAIVIQGWESIKPYKVGIVRGVKFAENGTFDAGIKPIVANDFVAMMNMLDKRRVEVAIFPLINGLAVLKKENIQGIKALSPPIASIPLYHYLHKKNENLIPRLQAVLQAMQKAGRFETIRSEYMLRFK